jgi:hypothetical protein
MGNEAARVGSTVGKPGDERGAMRIHAPTRGPALGDHEHLGDSHGTPTAGSRDLLGVPNLAIERRKHGLDIRDNGLGLDHERSRCGRIPGKDVDRATLGANCICDLRGDLPACPAQEDEHVLDEACVIGVEESIGRLALPIDPKERPCIERGSEPGKRVQPEPPCATPLNPRDQRLRDTGSLREIDLAPTLVHPDRAKDATDPNDVHARRVGKSRYPPLIERVAAIG